MGTEFNLEWNNVMSNKAPGLTPYEISSFLTNAQELLVTSIYRGTATPGVGPFEDTEETMSYLDVLVNQKTLKPQNEIQVSGFHIVPDSILIELPEDLMFRTYESCVIDRGEGKCGGEKEAAVVPVTQDEFWKTSRNPFRGQNAHKVLRLAVSSPDTRYSELVSKFPIVSYLVRYIRYPEPIILEDLPDGLTINGKSKEAACELNDNIHRRIVTEAVNMAKAAWS